MITLSWEGNGLRLFEEATKALGDEAKARKAYSMALNKTIVTVNVQVKRVLSKQMGVTQANLVKHGKIVVRKASAGNLVTLIDSRGGYLPLKDFRPRQTKTGVWHGAWGRRELNERTWINRGKLAKTRIGPGGKAAAGGHVFKNTGEENKVSGRNNAIESEWGPAVPNEMVKNESEKTFYRIADERMPIELDRAITKLAGKIL